MIIEKLVAVGLIACGTLLPRVTSVYRWKGNTERSTETMAMLKTRAALFGKIERAVLKMHSYEVPEIVALPIIKGHAPYLRWIDTNCR